MTDRGILAAGRKARVLGTRERRQRELEDRREAILEKSRELFFERGYGQVSVQDICDAVEYGRSALYALFGSKEEIYAHIYVEAVKILADMCQSLDPRAPDFDGEFLKCADIFFEFFRTRRHYFKALFHFNTSTLAYSKIPPKMRELKEAEIARASAPAIALAQRAVDEGLFRPCEPQEVVQLYWSTLVGVIMSFIHQELEEEEDTIRRFCHFHSEIYLQGLKAR